MMIPFIRFKEHRKGPLVTLLVVVAIGAWIEAAHKMSAIRERARFYQSIEHGLRELNSALEAVAKDKKRLPCPTPPP